jgi:hypothetical protein
MDNMILFHMMIESRHARLLTLEEFENKKYTIGKVEAWIETHPGKFSIVDICDAVHVSYQIAKPIIESSPLVSVVDEELKRKPGPQKRYLSVAVLPDPTPEGLEEEANVIRRYSDTLGKEAREDFHELVRVRRLFLHQGKRRGRPRVFKYHLREERC